VAAILVRGGMSVDIDEVRSWANARLAKTQRLCAVIVREEFPRNALGKVQKLELRKAFEGLRLP
jgi:hypothetical protein